MVLEEKEQRKWSRCVVVVVSSEAPVMTPTELRHLSQIMYNALTHTFQSQRLLRHLARALVALGSYVEAGKAVDLYVDLWDKSKETDAKAVAREMAGGEVKEAEEEVVVVDEADVDEDRQFVEFAVWGTRVFERLLRREGRAFEIAERVKEVVDADATLKEDSKLGEVVERALGVTLGSLVRKGTSSDCSGIPPFLG